MSAGRIHRYILKEITVPMKLGLLIFTFVLLMGRSLKLMELVINKGVPFGEIARLFLYLMPSFLVITIPLAFLLGILLGFGRLSSESEVIALKSSGVSIYTMMTPVLLVALLASTVTAALTLVIEPTSNAAFRAQVFRIATSRASVGVKPMVFNDAFEGLTLYTSEIEDRSGRMHGVFISDERAGEAPAAIFAREGRIISDAGALALTLRLEDGSIHRRLTGKKDGTYQVIDFSTYDINLGMGQNLGAAKKRPKKENELPLSELLTARATAAPAEQKALTVGLHKRFILASAPFLFALVGVPLGIRSHRSGKGGGFALALAIFLIYYVLLSFAKTLAVEKGFPIIITLWLPNLIFLTGGLTLLHFSAHERQIPLPSLERLRRVLPGRREVSR